MYKQYKCTKHTFSFKVQYVLIKTSNIFHTDLYDLLIWALLIWYLVLMGFCFEATGECFSHIEENKGVWVILSQCWIIKKSL